MSRRRRRRQTEKPKRPIAPEVAAFAELAVFRQATRVKRLAYTRTQAAQALGISTSTFERRILPFIETIQMDWGKRFIPVDELERFLAARRQQARAELRRPVPPGRKPGLPPEVVTRIHKEHEQGKSLRRIAQGLNTDQVRTSQGGRQWWPSTVRAVLVRPSLPTAAHAGSIPDASIIGPAERVPDTSFLVPKGRTLPIPPSPAPRNSGSSPIDRGG